MKIVQVEMTAAQSKYVAEMSQWFGGVSPGDMLLALAFVALNYMEGDEDYAVEQIVQAQREFVLRRRLPALSPCGLFRVAVRSRKAAAGRKGLPPRDLIQGRQPNG